MFRVRPASLSSVVSNPECRQMIRLYEGDCDCESCGRGGLHPEALARLEESIRRTNDVRRQMRNRAGPMYALSRERSPVINLAWRAAGSPRRPRGPLIGRAALTGRPVYDPPDKETPEWRAWVAWQAQRHRLRHEMGYED